MCEKVLPDIPGYEKRDICPGCNGRLSYIKPPRCFVCGKQLYNENDEYCTDCRKRKHLFTQSCGVFAYDDKIKAAMYRFKYSNRREYAKFFGRSIVSRCGHLIRRWDPQVIIPVPMYNIKLLKRGYNQAELIADVMGEMLHLPVDTKILIRKKNTRPMKELNDEERSQNLQNAFKITTDIVKYNKILLVDDIYTTGSTIDACSRVLLDGGAGEVYAASVCIGNGY